MVSEQTPCKTTNSNVELVLCILFGWMGAHRFYTKKYKSAVLYLLAVGLCGIGWIVDIATIIKKMAKRNSACDSTSFDGNIGSSSNTYVFVSSSGKKYHEDPLCGGNKNLKRVLKTDAIAAGYVQCNRCRDYYFR